MCVQTAGSIGFSYFTCQCLHLSLSSGECECVCGGGGGGCMSTNWGSGKYLENSAETRPFRDHRTHMYTTVSGTPKRNNRDVLQSEYSDTKVTVAVLHRLTCLDRSFGHRSVLQTETSHARLFTSSF